MPAKRHDSHQPACAGAGQGTTQLQPACPPARLPAPAGSRPGATCWGVRVRREDEVPTPEDTRTQPTCDKGENALHEGGRLARGILPQPLGRGRELKLSSPPCFFIVSPATPLGARGGGALIVRPWGLGNVRRPHAHPGGPDSYSKRVPTLYPSSLTRTPPTEPPAPRRSAAEVRGPPSMPPFSPGAWRPRRRPPGTGPGSPWLAGPGERGCAGAGGGGGAWRPTGRRGGARSALRSPGSVTSLAGLRARAPPGPRLGPLALHPGSQTRNDYREYYLLR